MKTAIELTSGVPRSVTAEKGAVQKLKQLAADKKAVIITDSFCAENYLNRVKGLAGESETVITKSKEIGSVAALTAQLAQNADLIVALGAGLRNFLLFG